MFCITWASRYSHPDPVLSGLEVMGAADAGARDANMHSLIEEPAFKSTDSQITQMSTNEQGFVCLRTKMMTSVFPESVFLQFFVRFAIFSY